MSNNINSAKSIAAERLYLGGRGSAFADSFRNVSRRVTWADGPLIAGMLYMFSDGGSPDHNRVISILLNFGRQTRRGTAGRGRGHGERNSPRGRGQRGRSQERGGCVRGGQVQRSSGDNNAVEGEEVPVGEEEKVAAEGEKKGPEIMDEQ